MALFCRLGRQASCEAGPRWAGVKQAQHFPEDSQKKAGHPLALHRAFPVGLCPLPPLLGKIRTLNLPLIAGHAATAWETFFLSLCAASKENILMALSPERLHIRSEVYSTPPTPTLGDGGTMPRLPTPFADPALEGGTGTPARPFARVRLQGQLGALCKSPRARRS